MLLKSVVLLGVVNAALAQTTAVTACHNHGATQFCIDGDGNEGYITPAPTGTDAPSSYTGCHNHGSNMFCMDGEDEVQFVVEANETGGADEGHEGHGHEEEEGSSATENHEGHGHGTEEGSSETAEMDCHFHAGVEHCVPVNGEANSHEAEAQCEATDRDYDVNLRVGLLFAMLAVGALGCFGPVLVKKFFKLSTEGTITMVIKQFGTGIVISVAFVHLITHATLMFTNDCLTDIKYEATTAAIVMAGLFIAFLIEYICQRLLGSRKEKLDAVKSTKIDDEDNKDPSVETTDHDHDHHHYNMAEDDALSVGMLEMGIIFHSVLIGITLVVAGDSYFITLFIVIVFHQFFEGMALGSRIAGLGTSFWKKLLMALAFAITTPLGMGIGIGVLDQFNGNDPSTLIAIGTLDAFSAGVLIWVGIIEMWAHDWLWGTLATSSALKTVCSMISLIAGFVLMSLLGKWA